MRICQVCNSFPPRWGGTETHNYTLVRYLVDKGYDVEVVAIRDRSMVGESLESDVTRDISVHNIFLKKFTWKRQISELIQALGEFDVFDVHNIQFALPVNGNIILSLHFFELTCPRADWPRPCEGSFMRCSGCVDPARYFYWKHVRSAAIKKAGAIVVKYNSLRDMLLKTGVPEDKVYVVPHWIDVDRIKKLSEKKVRIEGVEDGDFVFMFFGRASQEKGPFIMLEAFSKMAKSHSNIKLVFLGNPFVRKKIEDFCRSRGISDRVLLLGAKPHDIVHRYLSVADCIVFSNKYFNYEWGLLEAMCSKKPIVATDVFATREILNEENAVLVQPSSDSVADGMEWVLNNKRHANKIASNAFVTVKKKHDMSNLELYDRLLERFK